MNSHVLEKRSAPPPARNCSTMAGITVNNVQPGPSDTDMNPAEGDFAA
jgi:hypothetical protein